MLATPPLPLGRLVRTLEFRVRFNPAPFGIGHVWFSQRGHVGFARETPDGGYVLRRVVVEALHLQYQETGMLYLVEPREGFLGEVEVRTWGTPRAIEPSVLSPAWCRNLPNVRYLKVVVQNADGICRPAVEGLPGYARIPIRAERCDVVVEEKGQVDELCQRRGCVHDGGETCAELLKRVVEGMVELRSLEEEVRE